MLPGHFPLKILQVCSARKRLIDTSRTCRWVYLSLLALGRLVIFQDKLVRIVVGKDFSSELVAPST